MPFKCVYLEKNPGEARFGWVNLGNDVFETSIDGNPAELLDIHSAPFQNKKSQKKEDEAERKNKIKIIPLAMHRLAFIAGEAGGKFFFGDPHRPTNAKHNILFEIIPHRKNHRPSQFWLCHYAVGSFRSAVNAPKGLARSF